LQRPFYLRLDNSQCKAWLFCKLYWYERYHKGIERDRSNDPAATESLDIGTRVHQLLEIYYKTLRGDSPDSLPRYLEHHNPAVEQESQLIMASYPVSYPVESFDIVDVERTFEVTLNDNHSYTGKFDGIVRDVLGDLYVLEHKTEKRGGKNNEPKAWAARNQGARYQYAAEKIYGEPCKGVILNVLRRPSPKGQIGPEFPPRQVLFYSDSQVESAIRNIIVVADEIQDYLKRFTDGWFPSNTEGCYSPWECEFARVHTFGGWSDELLKLYKPTEKYLDL
jgi:hypothetical protein